MVLLVLTAAFILIGLFITIARHAGPPCQAPTIHNNDAFKDCLLIAIVILLSAILYVGRIGFYSDDWAVLGHLNLRPDQSLTNLVQKQYDTPTFKMRPVQALYLAILYWGFGLQPLGYHVVNTGVVVLSVIPLYLTLRELRQRRVLVLTIPLVYALLPHYSTDRFWYAAFMTNLSMAFYFLSIYSDLRALRAPLGRFWAWKLLSIVGLLTSTLAYEVVLPLFFFNLFLVWFLRKRNWSPLVGSLSSMTIAFSIAGSLLALISVILFKISTMTARFGNQLNLLDQTASIAKRAFDLNYSYGFNFKQACKVNFGDYGIGLPKTIWRIANDYPNVEVFALGVAVGIIILMYLYPMNSQLQMPLSAYRSEMAKLVAWGIVLFFLGYAVFWTNSAILLTTTGIGNRVNIAAAVGVSLTLVGGLGCLSSILPSTRWRMHSFGVLVSLLCTSGFLINNTIATFWIKAYTKEKEVLVDIQRHVQPLPKGSTLLLDGVCPYLGPAIVFESSWDLAGALKILYRDDSLRADVVTPKLEVKEDGIYTRLYSEHRYPYENVFVYHFGQKMTYRLTGAESARRYFETHNPNLGGDCPQGRAGAGVPVF